MAVVFSNNAKTTLAATVSTSATSITVTDGSVFPSISGSEYFYVTLQVSADGDLLEIVKVTARSGNTLTVIRSQDGTSARAFSLDDKCELRLTAAALNDAVLGGNTTEMSLNQFTGDGSTTAFTLSSAPDENLTNVFLSGVYQSKSNYSLSGATLTFSTAPPNGLALEIMVAEVVEFAVNVVADDSVTSDKLSNALSTKIAGIESGATADQTDAEIRTAVEAASDSNVFTDADHTKLDGIAASANNYVLPSGYATETYVNTQVTNLVDSSPAALDTLQELATALGDDANFSTTVTNSIATKAALAGATFTGEITANGGIALGDNDKATFGASDDLQIYHDASNSYISDVGIGDLRILGANVKLAKADGSENYIHCAADGPVQLYYNNSAKLATTSTGIDVTGTVTADGVLSAGSFNPSSSSWTTGSFRTSGSYGGGLSIIDSSAGWGIYAQNSGTTLRFGQGSTSGGLTEKMQINTSGIVVTGVVAAGDGSVTAPSVRGTDANTGLFFPSGGVTAITRNGVEGMRIDALGVTTFKGEVKISTAANKKLTFADDGGTFRAGMQAVTTGGQMISASAANDFAIRAQTNMLFATGGNTERMRILSDGAACFGTTTSRPAEFSHPDGFAIRFDTKGQFQNTVTNAPCGIINRDGTDGDILVFRKDGSGTPVGSIGTIVGQPYFTSQSRGIRIAGNNIRPTATAGANLDNVITLGASGQRFKDLYLSGGVYLGGTGAANKLDDYEEGTWTPTVVQGSVSTSSANYTKTGRTVVLSCVLSNFTNDTSTSAVTIAGLPFASKAASVAVGSMLIRGTNRSGILTISPFISSSSSQMTFYLSHENSTVYSPLQHDHFTSTTADIIAEITYITT